MHSDHKTHITAVQPPKLALEMVHIHTHTHTQKGGIYLEPVFTHLIPSPRHTALFTSPFLSNHTCVYNARNNRTNMHTNYISLKSRSKIVTHKTTKLTKKWNFRRSSYWHI